MRGGIEREIQSGGGEKEEAEGFNLESFKYIYGWIFNQIIKLHFTIVIYTFHPFNHV